MAEELHDKLDSESGGTRTSRTAIYCKDCGTIIVYIFNPNEIPVDVPDRPCPHCGSRNFGLKKDTNL